MSDQKTERQLNLLFVLLNAKSPIEREEIRKRVPGYFDKSNEAFERMFERDKENLRELGIPIEALPIDVFHEDNFGYLIKESNWLLPEIDLSSSERTLLNLAASVWSYAQISATDIGAALETAVKRFTAKQSVAPKIELDIPRQGELLDQILQAKSRSKCVEFTYFTASREQQAQRTVSPWRIFLSKGQSYLVGFDQDKGEPRVFRLLRIIGKIKISSEDAIEKMPKDLNVTDLVNSWKDRESTVTTVTLEVQKLSAGELRLLATEITYGDEFDLLRLDQVNPEQIIPLILKNCDVVRVISPVELIAQIDRHLMGVVN